MTFKLNAPEPRPVFIDLSFGSCELAPEAAANEVYSLHDAIQERLQDNPSIKDWGHLAPIALVGPDNNGHLNACTIVCWPDDEAIASLDEFMSSYWSHAQYRILGPSHDEWKDYLEVFWDHGYQFNPDANWRRD